MLCIGLKNAETSVNTYWGRQKWKALNEETSRGAKCSIVMTSSNYTYKLSLSSWNFGSRVRGRNLRRRDPKRRRYQQASPRPSKKKPKNRRHIRLAKNIPRCQRNRSNERYTTSLNSQTNQAKAKASRSMHSMSWSFGDIFCDFLLL